MADFDSLYTLGEKIGDGNFAEVKVCCCQKSGKKYAAKIIRMKQKTTFGHYTPNSRGMTSVEVNREVEILRSVDHESIVKFHDFHMQNEFAILVLELVSGGELFARVAELEKIEESEASFFIFQILQGVDHMHRLGIVHLDLKPENIMIENIETKKIKIIDFGLARKLFNNETIQDMAGTPEYCAPEIVNFDPITFATDMWSIGVMTYILLSGISPFAGDTQLDTFKNILKNTVNFGCDEFKGVPEEATDFISRLLRKDPRKRDTAARSLRHPWVDQNSSKAPSVQPQVIQKQDLNAILTGSRPIEKAVAEQDSTSPVVKMTSNVPIQNKIAQANECLAKPIVQDKIEKMAKVDASPLSTVQPQVIEKLDLNFILANGGITNNNAENITDSKTIPPTPGEQYASEHEIADTLPIPILENGIDNKKVNSSASNHRRISVPKEMHQPITSIISANSAKDTQPLVKGTAERKTEIPMKGATSNSTISEQTNSKDNFTVHKHKILPLNAVNANIGKNVENKKTSPIPGLIDSQEDKAQPANSESVSNTTVPAVTARRQANGTLLERASKWIESKNHALDFRRPSIPGTSSKFSGAFHHARSSLASSIAERKMIFTRDINVNGHGFRWRLQTDNTSAANQ